MIIPTNEQCRKVLDEMEDMDGLSKFESDFVESNSERITFTDKQKLVIHTFALKYQFESFTV